MRKVLLLTMGLILYANLTFASSIVYSGNAGNGGPEGIVSSSVELADRIGSVGKEVFKDEYIPKAMNEVNGIGTIAGIYSQKKGKPYKLVDVYTYYEYEPSNNDIKHLEMDKIDASLYGRYTRYNRTSGIDTFGTYFVDLMDAKGNVETLILHRMNRMNTEVNCVHPAWLFDEQFNEVLLFDYDSLKDMKLDLSHWHKTRSQSYKYWIEYGHADKSWIKVYCDPVDWD